MELLKLSKFKLHLRALIAEVRELKEREQSASEHLHLSIQKQKSSEEEFSRKIQELHEELVSSQDLQHKLEKKVNCVQNDNVLLENKQKELKATIDTLLQSRESFLAQYEDSTSEMKRAIEVRDRKLAVLSEKILAQSSLFDMIEKEAVSVKQVLEYVQRLVSEKEDVVSGLKRKLDQISTFEKEFVEKIHFLENKLRYNKEELRRKNSVISELEGRLEGEKISNNCQPQIDELQKSLSVKEETIQNLTAEKKALSFEVWSLEIILLKIQDAVTNMNEEDQKVFTSVLKGQEECAATTTSENENNRSGDMVQENREESPYEDTGQAAAELIGSPQCEKYNPAKNISQEKNNFDSCISEQLVCSPHQSASSDLQPATNVHNTPTITNINKGTSSTPSMQLRQLDSESSTTEAEGSEGPGRV